MNVTTSDTNLSSIEEALAYQEQKISDLSEVVARQWKEIDALKKNLVRMQDKIFELEEDVSSNEGGKSLSVSDQAARDKPPHY